MDKFSNNFIVSFSSNKVKYEKFFFSNKKPSSIISIVKKQSDGGEGVRVGVKVKHRVTGEEKKVNIYLSCSEQEFTNKLRAVQSQILSKAQFSGEKYRVVVVNNQTPKIDKKSFTFIDDKEFSVVFEKLRKDINEIINIYHDKTIVFDYEKHQYKTHRIVLYKAGDCDSHAKYKNSSSFLIDFPNFSSGEIINLLLSGGQKHEENSRRSQSPLPEGRGLNCEVQE